MLHKIFCRWGSVNNFTYFIRAHDVMKIGSKLASWYNYILDRHCQCCIGSVRYMKKAGPPRRVQFCLSRRWVQIVLAMLAAPNP